MMIAPHLADIRLADHQFPPSCSSSFWISADRPGWTVWFAVPNCGNGPARCETFNTRFEAEAYIAGVTFAAMALVGHAKTKARA